MFIETELPLRGDSARPLEAPRWLKAPEARTSGGALSDARTP
jgi:hypothetical protein